MVKQATYNIKYINFNQGRDWLRGGRLFCCKIVYGPKWTKFDTEYWLQHSSIRKIIMKFLRLSKDFGWAKEMLHVYK